MYMKQSLHGVFLELQYHVYYVSPTYCPVAGNFEGLFAVTSNELTDHKIPQLHVHARNGATAHLAKNKRRNVKRSALLTN